MINSRPWLLLATGHKISAKREISTLYNNITSEYFFFYGRIYIPQNFQYAVYFIQNY